MYPSPPPDTHFRVIAFTRCSPAGSPLNVLQPEEPITVMREEECFEGTKLYIQVVFFYSAISDKKLSPLLARCLDCWGEHNEVV